MDVQSQVLTLSEVQAELRLADRTLRRLVATGELPVIRLGQRVLRVRREDLEAYLRSRRQGGGAA
jgi:excisionase family DNA binding protein